MFCSPSKIFQSLIWAESCRGAKGRKERRSGHCPKAPKRPISVARNNTKTLDFVSMLSEKNSAESESVNTPPPVRRWLQLPTGSGPFRLQPAEAPPLQAGLSRGTRPARRRLLALDSKVSILLMALVGYIRLDHLIGHIPTAAAKITACPNMTTPKQFAQMAKLRQQLMRTSTL